MHLERNRVGDYFKRAVLIACIVNLAVLGSVFLKPKKYTVFADGEITGENTKSIFINTAFIVMGSLGLQLIATANGLADDFAGSLGDLYDSWVAAGSIPVASITSALNTKLSVRGTDLHIGGTLYNYLINFLNYCGGAITNAVPSIFDTGDTPAFTYDVPGNYVTIPADTYTVIGTLMANNTLYYLNVCTNSSDNRFGVAYYTSGTTLYIRIIFGSHATFQANGRTETSQISDYSLNTIYLASGATYAVSSGGRQISNAADNFVFNLFGGLSATRVDGRPSNDDIIYLLFGAGAVAGTDGTITIPDPISRNYNDVNEKPFTGVGENDDVPIAIPGTFAQDWPLDTTADIPDAIPNVIPWVLDIPTALDVPIDIPWYPDPAGDIPPGSVPAPSPLVDVPLIVTPECEGLSACLLAGVQTVSGHISQFIHINEEIYNYTVITLLIGFAMFILGVFA